MSDKLPKKHLVVLGAGVCGLYAAITALRAGASVTVLEKKQQVGGLAGGRKRGENYYDIGVHMLHSFDTEIFDDVASMMGEERIEASLDARIRWMKNTYKYPLKFGDLVKEMPILIFVRGVLGLLHAELKRAFFPSDPQNAEEALIAFYGRPLYLFFFKDFTHKYWGIHPSDLSAEFIKRKMPRLSAVDFVRKMLLGFLPKKGGELTESSLEDEVLHYSAKGAHTMAESLLSEVVSLGGVIQLGVDIKGLDTRQKTVFFLNAKQEGVSIQADAMISTIPLCSLVPLCSDAPDSVLNAAKALRYKPMVAYGLLINKEQAMDGLYTYFRNRIFHRVGEPKNAGMKVTPSSATILIVESTCEIGDEKWNADESAKSSVIRDLELEGICKGEDILEWHTLRERFGYPIYAHGYEEHLEVVQGWVQRQPSFLSTGRQGGFTYPTMDKAMRLGAGAAQSLMTSFYER